MVELASSVHLEASLAVGEVVLLILRIGLELSLAREHSVEIYVYSWGLSLDLSHYVTDFAHDSIDIDAHGILTLTLDKLLALHVHHAA